MILLYSTIEIKNEKSRLSARGSCCKSVTRQVFRTGWESLITNEKTIILPDR